MKKALLNKKNLILILLAAIAIVAVAVVVFNSDASRKAEDGLSEKTADSDDELPESENGDQGEIYLDPQKKWEKENDAALRRRVETEHITGSAVAEIDSQTQPAEASPEAIVSVERAGYDMVVRGALISGYMNLLVYDGSGNIFDMIRTFSIDREFRMTNVPAGEYRIVVERPDIKGVSVSCLLKIYLELTKPELDLSNKISPSSRKIANPYGVSLIIEYGGESITIPAKSSSVVSFAEGSNDIVYYLKDENGVSEKIDAHITVDTTPPVVTLRNIKIKNDVGSVVFNVWIDEYPAYIKVDGKEFDMGGTDVEVPYSFGYIEDIEVMSIVVETADSAGNVTKTTLTRDSAIQPPVVVP